MLIAGKGKLSKDSLNLLEAIPKDGWKQQELFWTSSKQPLLAAYYAYKAAQTDSLSQSWQNAGILMTQAVHFARQDEMNENLVYYFIEGGLNCFEQVLSLDETNQEAKIGKATLLVDGRGDIMGGVGLLVEVAESDSTNIESRLKLGRLSLINGNLDKAVERFESVIELDNTNIESYYTLGSIATAKGDKARALKYFEKILNLETDEALKTDVKQRIEELKK